jgi:hypothetical protein
MVVDKTLVNPADAAATDTITVNLNNFADNGVVQFYLLSAPDPTNLFASTIQGLADGAVAGGSFTVSVPRQSVLLAIVPGGGMRPMPGGDSSRNTLVSFWLVDASLQQALPSSSAYTRGEFAHVPTWARPTSLALTDLSTHAALVDLSSGAAFTTARRVTRGPGSAEGFRVGLFEFGGLWVKESVAAVVMAGQPLP